MQKTEFIWFDGKLVPWDQAQVHVLTHALHYGDSVFEGIRCYDSHKGPSAHMTAVTRVLPCSV